MARKTICLQQWSDLEAKQTKNPLNNIPYVCQAQPHNLSAPKFFKSNKNKK